ncbi:MAG: hypothetical protein HEEMFOPI_01493 [Holosporales bacterium]
MLYKKILFLSMFTDVFGSNINQKIESCLFSDFKDIEIQLEESLKVCQNNEDQQSIKKDLAKIYFHLGKYNQARVYFEEIVNKDPNDLIFQAYLGAVYDELSEHIKAQTVLEDCLKKYRENMPNNMFDFAFTLMHLGKTLSQKGNYHEAEKSLLECIEKYQELSNVEYLIKAQTLLAETYMYKGDYKKAEPYFKIVIVENEKNSHPVIWTQLRLGRLYMFTGDYENAKKIFENGIKILKQDQNVDYDRLGWNLFYLGDIYRSLLNFDESETIMKEGLKAFETCGYDAQHQITQWGNAYLGRLYCDWEKYENAKDLLEESLKIHEEKYGPNNKRNVFIMQALANTYMHFQEYGKAESLIKRSLEIYEKQFGTEHTEYAQVLLDFGVLSYKQKDYETAINSLKTALQILEKEGHSSASKCQAFLTKIVACDLVTKPEYKADFKSHDASTVMQLHDQLLDAFREELEKHNQEDNPLIVSILGEKDGKKSYKMQQNFFFSGDIKWYGITEENRPNDFESVLKIIEEKKTEYVKGRSEKGQSSHAVCIKNGFVFKFLNLTKEDGTLDEEPEMEMICSSFYHFMGIPSLIAQTALIEIESLGLIQISKEIKEGYTKESELDENISGHQYIMSLLLSFGDAKIDNFRIDGKNLIAIDTEMAFRKPVRNHDERGAVFGNYCFLFRTDFNRRNIPDTVKFWLEEIWKGVNVENEMKAIFYQIFGNAEQQKQFEDEKTKKIYLMINEYKKRYDCFNKFFENEYNRENLFIYFVKFYLNLNSIYEKITENEGHEITYFDLLVEYDSNLASSAIRSEGSSDHSAITKEEDIGLVNVSDFDYKYRIYRNYLHLINKKIENTSQWYSFLKDFPDVIVANRLQGLLEETNKEESLSFYEKILEKYRNDAEFLYKYGCLLSRNNEETRKISNASRSLLKQSADLGLDLAQFEYAELLWKDFEKLDKYQIDEFISIVNESLKYYRESVKSGLHFMQARYAEICLTLISEYPNPYDQFISEEDVFKYLSKAFDQEPYIYLHNIADLYRTIKDEDVKIKIENKLFEIAAKFLGKEITESESVQTIVQLIKDNTSSSPKKNNNVDDATYQKLLYEQKCVETDAKKGNPFAAFHCGMILNTFGNDIGAIDFLKIAAESGISRAQVELALCELKLQDKAPQEALDWLEKSANQKNLKAQNVLGELYYAGIKVDKDYKKAAEWFIKAANQGYAASQYNLGLCYYNGHGVTQNYVEAVKWFEKAANQGYAASQYNLGLCYYNGRGVTKDYVNAAEWFQEATKQKYANAQYSLGVCYTTGHGVTKDYVNAVALYREAEKKGHPYAQRDLGLCYYNGYGVTQNYVEAVKWFQKSANQECDNAQFQLGLCYYNGHGVTQNYVEAVKWFIKAANQGDSRIQYILGYFYEIDEGVKQDYVEAVKWYKKAADQGLVEAVNCLKELAIEEFALAQYYLGLCYYSGNGMIQNYSEAVKWFKKAASQKNEKALECLNELAIQGNEKAFKCIEELATQGDAKAKIYLGICYCKGHGVTQNYEKTVEWFQKASYQGNPVIQYFLGCLYEVGEEVEQDYVEAVEWYKRPADQVYTDVFENLKELATEGYEESQYYLGLCYYNGNGVNQNYSEAVKWFKKAASQKNKKALKCLNELAIQGNEKAFKCIEELATQGDTEAKIYLGICYCKGNGVTKNYEKSAEWFQKSADQKNVTSDNDLKIKKNYVKALEWSTKDANKGYSASLQNLENFYNDPCVHKNYTKATEWFQKSANYGYVLAQNKLGRWNLVGFHVPQNYKKAFEYFQKSADQECNKYVLTNIAILYFYGWGVIQDDEMALNIFAIAAEDGNEEAMYFLGHMFLNGCGIDKDSQKAVDFFKKSSEKEFFPALYTMGVFFEEGKYIDKDPEKANEFYKKAFEQFPRQYNTFSEFYSHIMGEMYEYGRGVEKNIAEALKWYERGAKQNHPASQRAIERCNNSSSLSANTHTL